MDNMSVRKKQLEQLDKFVKQLYDDAQMMKKYGVDLKDLEMLYLHIHELIEELLQCDTTDEFMAMIQQLHEAVAGVLIVIAPASAGQVKQDMADTHTQFNDKDFEEFINNLNQNGPMKNSKTPHPEDQDLDNEPQVENDVDDLVRFMDLEDHVKPGKKEKPDAKKEDDSETPLGDPKKKPDTETETSDDDSDDPDADPFDDVYSKF